MIKTLAKYFNLKGLFMKDKTKHKTEKPEATLANLIKSTEVMKAIRSQFGYSGYSNPNYINLDNQIKENEKFLEGLK